MVSKESKTKKKRQSITYPKPEKKALGPYRLKVLRSKRLR